MSASLCRSPRKARRLLPNGVCGPLVVLAALCGVGGCDSMLRPPFTSGGASGPGAPVQVCQDETGKDMVAYLRKIDELRGKPRQREYARVERAFSEDPNNPEQLRLGWLLSHPNPEIHNPDPATALLKDHDAGVTSNTNDLTKLVQTTIERRTARAEALHRLQQALADERARVKQLEDQIQALTTIEKSFQQDAGIHPERKSR